MAAPTHQRPIRSKSCNSSSNCSSSNCMTSSTTSNSSNKRPQHTSSATPLLFNALRFEHHNVQQQKCVAAQRRSSLITSASSSSNSTTTCPETKKKRVSFQSGTKQETIHIIDCVLDIIEDPEDIWYSKSEYKQIRSECHDTVQRLKAGEPEIITKTTSKTSTSPLLFCYRGLEYKIPEKNKQRKYNISKSEHIVWICQQEHIDADIMARRYGDHARHCEREAYFMGIVDAKEAQLYLYDNDDDNVSLPITTSKHAVNPNHKAAEIRKDFAPSVPRRTWAAAC